MKNYVTRQTAAFIGVLAVLMALAPTGARAADPLAAVRQATVAYLNTDAAAAAGFTPLLACIDMPGVGGMGQHLADQLAFDSTVDPLHPEALVYEVRGDALRLVAVEYIVPQAAWSSADPPSLFGQPFHRNDALGIWALHAWIWRGNPTGMFEDFNPNVRLCP
jgi:hypothetical protein